MSKPRFVVVVTNPNPNFPVQAVFHAPQGMNYAEASRIVQSAYAIHNFSHDAAVNSLNSQGFDNALWTDVGVTNE